MGRREANKREFLQRQQRDRSAPDYNMIVNQLPLEVPCIAVGRRPDETIFSNQVERDSSRFGR